MLGQPASSHTVCRPSRRTNDLSSVYSGPVLSRVLIHSGLRSIGTWLLRTSSRSSLRPEGDAGVSVEGVGATVSLMIDHGPPGNGNARLDRGGRCCSGGGSRSARRVALVVRVGAQTGGTGLRLVVRRGRGGVQGRVVRTRRRGVGSAGAGALGGDRLLRPRPGVGVRWGGVARRHL